MPMRCRCPPERRLPHSPTRVSIPRGSEATNPPAGPLRGLRRPPAVDFGGRDTRRDVGSKRSVGEEQVLRDIADAVLPCPAVCGGEGCAVDGDFSRCGFVKAQQEVEKGGLACARRSADADAFAPADGEREAAEKVTALFGEAEREAADRDFALEGRVSRVGTPGCAESGSWRAPLRAGWEWCSGCSGSWPSPT